MRKANATIVFGALLPLLVACSSNGRESTTTADPAFVFSKVKQIRSGLAVDVVEPTSLEDALPSGEMVVDPATGVASPVWSDVVVTGRIIEVKPGSAVVYDNVDPGYEGDEEKSHYVDFDDPAAHERDVIVIVKPEWSEGNEVAKTVEFRMGVLGGADPYEFMASLRGLQSTDVAVVLDDREDGREEGDYYPIMGGALIGTIGQDGALSFPALGAGEQAFLGDIDTVEELQQEAATPPGATS